MLKTRPEVAVSFQRASEAALGHAGCQRGWSQGGWVGSGGSGGRPLGVQPAFQAWGGAWTKAANWCLKIFLLSSICCL